MSVSGEVTRTLSADLHGALNDRLAGRVAHADDIALCAGLQRLAERLDFKVARPEEQRHLFAFVDDRRAWRSRRYVWGGPAI